MILLPYESSYFNNRSPFKSKDWKTQTTFSKFKENLINIPYFYSNYNTGKHNIFKMVFFLEVLQKRLLFVYYVHH